MQKYAALISYVGTHYCGWQSQVKLGREGGLPSIQATLQRALEEISGERAAFVGSGRTDSGVHALGQVAHFTLHQRDWDPAILQKALNSKISPQIRIRQVMRVHPDFHAQRGALKKQYSYYFQQGSSALPHLTPYTRWVHKSLDVPAMNRAASYLVGEHDFKPFQASGAKLGSTVRSILEASVDGGPIGFPGESQGAHLIRFRVVGTGFLKQMVRGIAGTLLQIGEGKREPGCMQEILSTGDRKKVGPTAAARGLWLERVWYPEEYRAFSL